MSSAADTKSGAPSIYTSLAPVYDEVMEEVDYDEWADFLDEIMQTHHRDPKRILELACGTGSISLSLDELMCYHILATDISPEMLEVGRRKTERLGADVQFKVMDFLDIELNETFDIALCIFDSINYLHTRAKVKKLLDEVHEILEPGGLFIFDFTTPRNSRQAIQFLDDEEGYASDRYYYHRKSSYDEKNRIHINAFDIKKLDKSTGHVLESYYEEHRQRIYTLNEMEAIISESPFNAVAMYEGFDLIEANEESLRITAVLRCPTIPS